MTLQPPMLGRQTLVINMRHACDRFVPASVFAERSHPAATWTLSPPVTKWPSYLPAACDTAAHPKDVTAGRTLFAIKRYLIDYRSQPPKMME
jgi:hypothetical protein